MKKLSFLNFALASMAMMLCFSCSDDEAGSFSLSESGMKYVNEGIHLKAKDVQESFMLVETDAMWSAIGDDNWVITTPRYGNAQAIQKTLRISAIENKRFGERMSNVVIKSNGKGNSYTIKVYQECPETMTFPSSSGASMYLALNAKELSPLEGDGNISASIKDEYVRIWMAENTGSTQRKAKFAYVANDGYKDFDGTFEIIQVANKPLPETFVVSYEEKEGVIYAGAAFGSNSMFEVEKIDLLDDNGKIVEGTVEQKVGSIDGIGWVASAEDYPNASSYKWRFTIKDNSTAQQFAILKDMK